MEPADVPVNLAFSDERFYPQLLYGSTRLRAFLLCLTPGQRLPAREDSEEAFCYVLAGRGRFTLGDRVLMKVKGLDARLAGDLKIGTGKGNTLTGLGEIRVADGRYAAYGIALPITRGRLMFGGGPIEEPHLEVLADRR